MSNEIGLVNAEQVTINQTSALFASIINGTPEKTLKLSKATNTTPPLFPIKYTRRSTLLNDVTSKLKSNTLLHITGEIGMGKTQLCNLLLSDSQSDIYWFKTKNFSAYMHSLFREINDAITKYNKYNPFQSLSKSLHIAPSSIIVLDDIPDLAQLDIIDELVKLIEVCNNNNITIITSSNYPLPTSMELYLSMVQTYHISGFSTEETIELLNTYNAPSKVINMAKLINVFSNDHPTLIIATINYLQSNDWVVNVDDFFANKFIDDELSNTQRILEKTVPDINARELLYRLNNLGRNITDDDIRLISSIEPTIEHPFEKFNLLLNIWAYKESASEYLLSPLVLKLGSKNLSPELEKNISHVLGENIFRKRTLTPFDVSKGISYLTKAQEYNLAGFRLIQALYSVVNQDDIVEDDLFLIHLYWAHTSLPEEMNTTSKLIIRALQIVLAEKFGNDSSKLYEDYLQIEVQVKEDERYAFLLSHLLFVQHNFHGFAYLEKIFNDISFIPKDLQSKLDFSKEIDGMPFEGMILMNVDKLSSYEDLSKWVSTVKKRPIEKLGVLFDSVVGFEFNPMLKQAFKKQLMSGKDAKELYKIRQKILELVEFSAKNSLQELWALAVGMVVDCLLESNNIDEATVYVHDAIGKTNNEFHQLIIINDLAMHYLHQNNNHTALKLFEKVIDIHHVPFVEKLVDACAFASVAYGRTNRYEQAKYYIEKAIMLYIVHEPADTAFTTQLLGEYSIILWHLNMHMECLSIYEQILFNLEQYTDNIDKSWKDIEMILGHNLGYIFSMISSNKPPKDFEGGEIYSEPMCGTFLFTNSKLNELYNPQKHFLIYYQLYQSYYYLNDVNKARKYMFKSFEASAFSDLEEMKVLLKQDIYLIQNDYEKYFEYVKTLPHNGSQDLIGVYILISLLNLIGNYLNDNDFIDQYKNDFQRIMIDVFEKNNYKITIYTLDKIKGYPLDSFEVEKKWLIHRIFMLSELQNCTLSRALNIHNHLFEDLFKSTYFPSTASIQHEIYVKYFYNYWKLILNTKGTSFKYLAALQNLVDELYNKKISPQEKVSELLVLIDRYRHK